MKNRYNATCATCGCAVLAGAGDTNLNDSGHWVTKHVVCPAPRAAAFSSPTYRDPELDGLTGRDYDDEFYRIHGMTQADYRDAVNPDEGDH